MSPHARFWHCTTAGWKGVFVPFTLMEYVVIGSAVPIAPPPLPLESTICWDPSAAATLGVAHVIPSSAAADAIAVARRLPGALNGIEPPAFLRCLGET